MSVLQIKNNETKLFESEKCIDKEYTVESRETSRLPPNFIQYWIDTGHLPFQLCKNAIVHSDTGSSLSEEGSLYKQYTICNTMLKDKLNDKQLCNNGSSNSSVDTAAYVLSNTNITKKENIYHRFFKKDEVLRIHKDINYKDNKIDTAGNIYDTTDSNISNKKYAFDMYSSNEMYKKDKEFDGIGYNLPTSCKEDITETCKNDNQINKDDFSCQNKEFDKNSIEMAENITNVNKNSVLLEDLHNDSVRCIRQKKLYVGRESPIDINISIVSKSIDIDINEEKRDLHPAYRNSPYLHRSNRKYVPKKRKYKFFLKNSRNKSQDDTSSNNSINDNIDDETHHAKRQKSLEDPINHADETQFFPTVSQMSGKDKLRQSCMEMEKQIMRFPISEFIHPNDHISQGKTEFNKKDLKHGNETSSKIKLQGTITQDKTNVRTVSCNTLSKKHNPVVLLERLSENIIKRYTNRKSLQSKETRKNRAPVKNTVEETNKRNYRACSIMSKNTEPRFQLKNAIVHSENNDVNTIIINNNISSQSTNRHDSKDSDITLNSTSLPNSGNAEKALLETFPNDIKLTQMRPVVLLERLHHIESSTKKQSCKLNNLKNELQPIVVLEQLINTDKNSNHDISMLTYNEFNTTKPREVKIRETNKEIDYNYEYSTKLLYFTTNMSSDSDSDVSSTKYTLNLNSYMKYNSKNKTINQKSSNSSRISMLEDIENTKNNKKSFSKKNNSGKKYMSIHDSNNHTSTGSFVGKVSHIEKKDNLFCNFNKNGNNQMVHTLRNIQLRSDTSEKDKRILKNSVNDTVIVDGDKKKKRNKMVFSTKAYDSDSD